MNDLLIFLGAVGGTLWVVHKLVTHPYKRCPRCKGSGNIPAGLLGRYKRCPRCAGRGEVRGWLGRKD